MHMTDSLDKVPFFENDVGCQHTASSLLAYPAQTALRTILFEPLVLLQRLGMLSFRWCYVHLCAQKESFSFQNKNHAQQPSLDLIFSFHDISLPDAGTQVRKGRFRTFSF